MDDKTTRNRYSLPRPPSYQPYPGDDESRMPNASHFRPYRPRRWRSLALTVMLVGAFIYTSLCILIEPSSLRSYLNPVHAPSAVLAGLSECRANTILPGPPSSFASSRTTSDRFVRGTRDVWIRNATLWTGDHDSKPEIGDLLLSGGIILGVGKNLTREIDGMHKDYNVIDAMGRWVTPGIVSSQNTPGTREIKD